MLALATWLRGLSRRGRQRPASQPMLVKQWWAIKRDRGQPVLPRFARPPAPRLPAPEGHIHRSQLNQAIFFSAKLLRHAEMNKTVQCFHLMSVPPPADDGGVLQVIVCRTGPNPPPKKMEG